MPINCAEWDTSVLFFDLIIFLHNSALEYVAPDKRSLIGNLGMAVGFTLGGLYQAYLIKYLEEWETFHHILFFQFMLLILLIPL